MTSNCLGLKIRQSGLGQSSKDDPLGGRGPLTRPVSEYDTKDRTKVKLPGKNFSEVGRVAGVKARLRFFAQRGERSGRGGCWAGSGTEAASGVLAGLGGLPGSGGLDDMGRSSGVTFDGEERYEQSQLNAVVDQIKERFCQTALRWGTRWAETHSSVSAI